MSAPSRAPEKSERLGFVSVLKQAAAKEGLNGVIENFPEGSFIGTDFADITPPLSQTRWFQASAKAVRMSVLAHAKRAESRIKVNKQLREWADNKVADYTDVDLENLELVDLDQLDMDEKGPICPSARGLGSDLKQQWYSSVDEEVRRKVKEREAAMKAEMQAELDMVEDLRENVKVLKAELKEANGRAADLEGSMLRQQVAQASSTDRRKETHRELEQARTALEQAAVDKQEAARDREAAAQAKAAAVELNGRVAMLEDDLVTKAQTIQDLESRLTDACADRDAATGSCAAARAELEASQGQAGNGAEAAAEARRQQERVAELTAALESSEAREQEVMDTVRRVEEAAEAQQAENDELRNSVQQLQQTVQRQDAVLNGTGQEQAGAINAAQNELQRKCDELECASAEHKRQAQTWSSEKLELQQQVDAIQQKLHMASSDLLSVQSKLHDKEQALQQLQYAARHSWHMTAQGDFNGFTTDSLRPVRGAGSRLNKQLWTCRVIRQAWRHLVMSPMREEQQ
eukprot:jgi/Ulvmu1/733/UM010_0106.1